MPLNNEIETSLFLKRRGGETNFIMMSLQMLPKAFGKKLNEEDTLKNKRFE